MANKSAIKEVMKAFIDTMKADSNITSKLGSGANSITTSVYEKPAYPYIVLNEWTSAKQNTFTHPGKEVTARVWIYTKAKSQLQLAELLEAVTEGLDDVDLTLTSFQHIFTRYDDEEVFEEDRGESKTGVIIFTVFVQE